MMRNKLKRETARELKEARRKLKSSVSSASWWSHSLKLMVIIAFYFSASIALTFYQKDLIVRLPYPLTIVIVHLVLKFCLAGLCRYLWSKYTGENRVVLGWKDYLSKVAIVAVVSGLDIGLSQWSLQYITLSLYTMTKTTSTPFILLFGLLFKLERKHWSQIVIVVLISGGLTMFTYKSTSFSFIGFMMVLIAAFFSGIRWTMSQLIMQKSKLGLQNPVDFMYHIQPLMILSLLPIAISVEGVSIAATEDMFRFHELSEFTHTITLMAIGGLLAFCMEVAEFMVVTFASSLTLAIIGVVKEVTVLALAVLRNGNEISSVNLAGILICLLGIFAHVIRKAVKADEIETVASQRRSITSFEALSSSDDMDDHDNFFRRPRSRVPQRIGNEGLPLLNDSDDSETEMMQVNRKKSRSVSSDDYYLRENRTWTSIRDQHLEMRGLESKDEAMEAPILRNQDECDRRKDTALGLLLSD